MVKKKKQSVGGMVKNSIGMMVTGGMGGAVGSYGMGAGVAYTAKETTKGMGRKKKRKGISAF